MRIRAALVASLIIVSTSATASALTQSLRLPFPPGHTWYICQSYVGFSHQSNRPFDIGWTKGSCNANNDDSGGKPIAAPGAGKITRLPNKASGGDYMCLSLTGGGSIVLGHVKPATGVTLGKSVAAGEVIAAVRAAKDPDGQNAGIAHLHYEAFAGNDCYVGGAQTFTGAWRMQCAPDLPYNATYGFYNGTAITACAPDAGVSDSGADDGGATDAGDGDAAAPSVAPPARAEDPEPEAALPAPPEEEGCGIGARPRAPVTFASIAFVIMLATGLARRRRAVRERRAP